MTREFSARSLGAAAAGGAVTGALAAATGGASLVTQGALAAGRLATGAALSSMAGGMTERAIETGSLTKTLDPKAQAWDAAVGVGGLGAAKLVAKAAPVVKAGLVRAGKAIQRVGRAAGGVPAPGTLSKELTRHWYHAQLDATPSRIDPSLPLRERAR